MKEMVRSFSKRAKRTHWWNLMSSKSTDLPCKRHQKPGSNSGIRKRNRTNEKLTLSERTRSNGREWVGYTNSFESPQVKKICGSVNHFMNQKAGIEIGNRTLPEANRCGDQSVFNTRKQGIRSVWGWVRQWKKAAATLQVPVEGSIEDTQRGPVPLAAQRGIHLSTTTQPRVTFFVHSSEFAS